MVLPLSGQVDTQPLEEVMTPSPTATKPVEVTPEKAQSSMSVTRMFVSIHVNIKDIGILHQCHKNNQGSYEHMSDTIHTHMSIKDDKRYIR